MRWLILFMLFTLIYIVSSKNNVKTLTESLGQEVIEIGSPIKELPMGLEEEPSAENEDYDKQKITTNTVQPATKKDSKKTTTLAETRKKMKDIEKIDGMSQDDEDARIEKELAEIYKDTADYKTDSAEEVKEMIKEPDAPIEVTTDDSSSLDELEKPIGRQRNNFKFQPDTTNKNDIEKFRTSVDSIVCNSRQKLIATPAPDSTNATNSITTGLGFISVVLCYIFLCS